MKLIKKEQLRLLSNHPEEQRNVLRQLRKPLLEAMDIYDKNVSKGRITESIDQKRIVDSWYKSILDLEESAFDNVPEVIKQYL